MGQSSPVSLRAHDVCVALQVVLTPRFSYRELARSVGLSLGESHNSVRRLELARLVLPHQDMVNIPALLEFLVHGVPYVFPGALGPESQGVPTAHSGPVLSEIVPGVDSVVWPSLEGGARGHSLTPLCRQAPLIARSNHVLYRWLTVVDALRIGRARDRKVARDVLHAELEARAGHR
jgi:hypothetical protein